MIALFRDAIAIVAAVTLLILGYAVVVAVLANAFGMGSKSNAGRGRPGTTV